MQAQAVIYWIRLPEHTDPNTQGYVGVSKRYEARLMDHFTDIQKERHTNPHLVNAVNKYGWDKLIKEIIYEGDESSCYEMEKNYRTTKAIGWNIAPGGHRGPGWPVGKKKSKQAVKKQQATMIERFGAKFEANKEAKVLSKREKLEQRESVRLAKINEIEIKRERRLLKKQQNDEAAKIKKEKYEERLATRGNIVNVDKNANLSKRPICPSCNKNRCAINYWKSGTPHYRKICDGCGKKKPKTKANMATWEKVGYKKKATCDLCGFKCLYPTQMIVFHIDGSLINAAMTNLRTICLNCVEVVKKKDVKWKRGDLTVDH